jgi:ADP-ribosyl-[dinitrogen reductase] hydrolase
MPLLEPAPDTRPQPLPHLKRRFRGCLLGGAVGDALGAPVEFMALAEIRANFGRPGITEFTTAFDRKGAITDDTQMTLFTAEGLLRAYVQNGGRDARSVTAAVAHAYTRWLRTQGAVPGLPACDTDGWLFEQRELHALRVPGATCLEALQTMSTLGQRADNDSKGSGGLMRMAPVGLWCARLDDGVPLDRVARRALELGAELAGITHGHPTGRLAAGALAALVSLIVRDVPLPLAVERVVPLLPRYPGHAETLRALELARTVARGEAALRPETVVTLGEGWVADEALAIALACALNAADFESGVRVAVNHDGDSDTTASVTGNLLGAMHGVEAIPQRWLAGLEARRIVAEVADDLATFPDWPLGEFVDESDASDYYRKRYPGS